MIHYRLKGHRLANEVQTIAQVFYPNRHYYEVEELVPGIITIDSTLTEHRCLAEIYKGNKMVETAELVCETAGLSLVEKKRMIKGSIYQALRNLTGYRPPWGFLTGIRPAKKVNEYCKAGHDEKEALQYLIEKYDVQQEKAKLAVEVAKAEQKILSKQDRHKISIYIGIPFCPTRCLYCSFPSYPLAQYQHRVEDYLKALCLEIKYLGKIAKRYEIETIYIGGGTPTSFQEKQIEKLLCVIQDNFSMQHLKEYTMEAGRPDTITEEKLKIMKKYGIDRISINPQTMNQRTLDLVGRKHTVEEIRSVFYLARAIGYQNINMDLILGLPGETSMDVENTMAEIKKLSPESITVHTLAVKRASRLKETLEQYEMTKALEMEKMLAISYQAMKKQKLSPYYMYRQKNMVGSFENVGYCKKGFESIYNIQIMEETQTILAAGAGATTKIVDFDTNRIDRIFNVKSVEDYITRIQEMMERKKKGLGM